MNILHNIYRNLYLSPTYCAGMALGAGVIIQDIQKNQKPGKVSACGLLLLTSGTPTILYNFFGYRKLLHLMQTHGYSEKICKLYLKTFCGRQQVKLAAKESGFTREQKLHFLKKNVRWYHFENHPLFNVILPIAEIGKCTLIPYLFWKSERTKTSFSASDTKAR